MTYITGQRQKLTGANMYPGNRLYVICWLVLGPSYFSENVVPLCSVFSIFLYVFAVFCGVRAKKTKRKVHIRTLDVFVSPYPWVDAIIALTRWLLLPRPGERASSEASGLGKQPGCTAEAVDLSAGAAIRGLLLLMLLLLRRVKASSPLKKLNAGVTCINFSFYYRIRLWSTFRPDPFSVFLLFFCARAQISKLWHQVMPIFPCIVTCLATIVGPFVLIFVGGAHKKSEICEQ